MINLNLGLQPDPKWHARLSFVKSGFRIAAGITLITNNLIAAGILFIIAEIIGIAEELV